MSAHQATTTWSRGSVLTARRPADSLAQWAAEHIAEVLGAGNSTGSTSGSGTYFSTVVGWTKDGTHYDTQVETWGTQADHDAAIEAIQQAVRDAGGTLD